MYEYEGQPRDSGRAAISGRKGIVFYAVAAVVAVAAVAAAAAVAGTSGK